MRRTASAPITSTSSSDRRRSVSGDLDLALLSQCYGRAFSAAELVVGGVNRTYRLVGDGLPFYLRLYRSHGRSEAEIAFELHLLRKFQTAPGIRVARPLATSDGSGLLRMPFEGSPRFACLFEALAGRPLARTSDDAALFGTALAKLHRALSGIAGGEMRPLAPRVLCEATITTLADIPSSGAVRQAVERHCLAPLSAPSLNELPSGNCHGDAWFANAIVRERSVGFFDFDDCGCGPYLLDLGTATWHLLLGGGANAKAHLAALIAGYETVRALGRAERQALPLFLKLAEVRSLLFLGSFCALTEDLWQDVLGRAENLLERDLTL